MVTALPSDLKGLRISGDRSKVFCLFESSIQAWSTYTREPMGKVKLELGQGFYLNPLQMDDSKIWICLDKSSTQGWDFGISHTLPVPLSGGSKGKPLLDFIGGASWQTEGLSWIKNVVTGKVI